MNTKIEIKRNAEVGHLATFGVAARAAALAIWHNAADLAAIVEMDELPRPLKVIGGGSNLLFTGDFGGTLLLRSGRPQAGIDGLTVKADAHIELDRLCELTAGAGLRGMENLSGIPGTLGGALVQNAGAYGAETGSLLKNALLFDLESARTLVVDREWMQYAYRSSRLKESGGRYVIVEAELTLNSADTPANLDYGNLRAMSGSDNPSPQAVREIVRQVRASKLPDPASVGSAGSFFRNPEVDAAKLTPEMPRYDLGNGLYKVPAAWLIDHAGMKGSAAGGASTWPTQPLVIVNTQGTASAADILELEHKIVSAVSERFSITLIPEVEHL